jgi:hypothetical protein
MQYYAEQRIDWRAERYWRRRAFRQFVQRSRQHSRSQLEQRVRMRTAARFERAAQLRRALRALAVQLASVQRQNHLLMRADAALLASSRASAVCLWRRAVYLQRGVQQRMRLAAAAHNRAALCRAVQRWHAYAAGGSRASGLSAASAAAAVVSISESPQQQRQHVMIETPQRQRNEPSSAADLSERATAAYGSESTAALRAARAFLLSSTVCLNSPFDTYSATESPVRRRRRTAVTTAASAAVPVSLEPWWGSPLASFAGSVFNDNGVEAAHTDTAAVDHVVDSRRKGAQQQQQQQLQRQQPQQQHQQQSSMAMPAAAAAAAVASPIAALAVNRAAEFEAQSSVLQRGPTAALLPTAAPVAAAPAAVVAAAAAERESHAAAAEAAHIGGSNRNSGVFSGVAMQQQQQQQQPPQRKLNDSMVCASLDLSSLFPQPLTPVPVAAAHNNSEQPTTAASAAVADVVSATAAAVQRASSAVTDADDMHDSTQQGEHAHSNSTGVSPLQLERSAVLWRSALLGNDGDSDTSSIQQHSPDTIASQQQQQMLFSHDTSSAQPLGAVVAAAAAADTAAVTAVTAVTAAATAVTAERDVLNTSFLRQSSLRHETSEAWWLQSSSISSELPQCCSPPSLHTSAGGTAVAVNDALPPVSEQLSPLQRLSALRQRLSPRSQRVTVRSPLSSDRSAEHSPLQQQQQQQQHDDAPQHQQQQLYDEQQQQQRQHRNDVQPLSGLRISAAQFGHVSPHYSPVAAAAAAIQNATAAAIPLEPQLQQQQQQQERRSSDSSVRPRSAAAQADALLAHSTAAAVTHWQHKLYRAGLVGWIDGIVDLAFAKSAAAASSNRADAHRQRRAVARWLARVQRARAARAVVQSAAQRMQHVHKQHRALLCWQQLACLRATVQHASAACSAVLRRVALAHSVRRWRQRAQQCLRVKRALTRSAAVQRRVQCAAALAQWHTHTTVVTERSAKLSLIGASYTARWALLRWHTAVTALQACSVTADRRRALSKGIRALRKRALFRTAARTAASVYRQHTLRRHFAALQLWSHGRIASAAHYASRLQRRGVRRWQQAIAAAVVARVAVAVAQLHWRQRCCKAVLKQWQQWLRERVAASKQLYTAEHYYALFSCKAGVVQWRAAVVARKLLRQRIVRMQRKRVLLLWHRRWAQREQAKHRVKQQLQLATGSCRMWLQRKCLAVLQRHVHIERCCNSVSIACKLKRCLRKWHTGMLSADTQRRQAAAASDYLYVKQCTLALRTLQHRAATAAASKTADATGQQHWQQRCQQRGIDAVVLETYRWGAQARHLDRWRNKRSGTIPT